MMLNATLIVQGIHFFIAYSIIHHVFLKKAVQEVMHNAQEQHVLEEDIKDLRNQVAQRELAKAQQWQSWRVQFKEHIPSLKKSFFKIGQPVYAQQEPLSEDQQKKYSSDIQHYLMKKVTE